MTRIGVVSAAFALVIELIVWSVLATSSLANDNAKVVRSYVFNAQGKRLYTIWRSSSVGWGIKPCSSEYSIFNSRGGRKFDMEIGHYSIGGGIRVSPHRYDVWATPEYTNWTNLPSLHGNQWLRGRIVWHGFNRWDLYTRRSRYIGYTIGPDGPAAGSAALLLGESPKACAFPK